ncbi:dihydroneopterin triphosphate diphosphatase [uncultured Limnohabitans sp.]|jgi:dihydroneopterin triphosphate diphosphatase|uniref:dihydroneopterin triphosphate diphosphatase n=1 Tax=uncultured Limnohabitans sp. TaxID=768543 RepID=UPI00261E8DF9|nr:dihydroneopterin triphosphate diphosphatase [uncultured Limnohabitans sp.]
MANPLPPSPDTFKIPESVLVLIYTPEQDVLLIRRTDWGTWQSVTGSKDHPEESWLDTAIREVQEETGIDALHTSCQLQDWELENVYDIYPAWRWRYAPEVSRNTERVFGLCVPQRLPVVLSPREHTEAQWLPWHAAADQCFSPSNAEAILMLPRFLASSSP